MPKPNIINYKYKEKTKTYIFVLSIFNKSFFTSCISVINNLNIIEMMIDGINNREDD